MRRWSRPRRSATGRAVRVCAGAAIWGRLGNVGSAVSPSDRKICVVFVGHRTKVRRGCADLGDMAFTSSRLRLRKRALFASQRGQRCLGDKLVASDALRYVTREWYLAADLPLLKTTVGEPDRDGVPVMPFRTMSRNVGRLPLGFPARTPGPRRDPEVGPAVAWAPNFN